MGQPQNMLVKYEEFDPVEDKYMAISINYRGDIKSKEANATVQWLKQNNKISFVEWCPTGFKIGLNEVPAAIVESDITAPAKKNVTMIGNNVAVSRMLTEHLCTGMLVKVWKKESFLRHAKTSDSWRKTTWMLLLNKRLMRLIQMRNSKYGFRVLGGNSSI